MPPAPAGTAAAAGRTLIGPSVASSLHSPRAVSRRRAWSQPRRLSQPPHPRRRPWRRLGVAACLLPNLVIAIEFVTQLLIVALVVLGKDEHADLLRRREARHRQRNSRRWRRLLLGRRAGRGVTPAADRQAENRPQRQRPVRQNRNSPEDRGGAFAAAAPRGVLIDH